MYHQIVENQRSFVVSGGLRSLNARREQLNILKKLLTENKKEILDAIYEDVHRVPETNNEVAMCVGEIETALAKLEEWTGNDVVAISGSLDREKDTVRVVKEAFGVVLVISPWNFPLATSCPIVGALAAGNTVVVKLSELAPHFADVFEKLVKKYFDPRVLTVINGEVQETTELLKERFDHILYTGNPMVAKIIMSAAAKNLTPVTLELGGKNPVFIDNDVDFDDVARKILAGKTLNCGQICISPDYILITAAAQPAFEAAFTKAIEDLGDTKTNKCNARMVNERHFDRVSALIEKSSGQLVYKAKQAADRSDLFLPLHVFRATIDDALLSEEIFGPVVPIITVSSFDDAILTIQAEEKPLAAYIFTKDAKKADRFVEETSSGGVCINDVMSHAFAPGVPFGGVGHSGMGRLNGKYSFDTFTHQKTVLARNGLGKVMARM